MGFDVLDITSGTAVVIGGTLGNGLTLAKGLARAGANVVPTGWRTELVQSATAEVTRMGR